jgi:hypothetical protein
MENKITKIDVAVLVLSLALIVPGALWGAYVFKILWGWFIVPVFSLPQLTTLQALGVHAVAARLWQAKTKEDEKVQEIESTVLKFFYACAVAFGKPGLALFWGWCIVQFM